MSEYGDALFRQKPDMTQVFVRQLDRKNFAGSGDYANSVIIARNNLPMRWRNWVKEQKDKYTTEELTLVYKTNCGVKLGSANNPLLEDETTPVKRDENGKIDWSDPNILSPRLQLLPHIDYTLMDEMVMAASEYAGLTWTEDPLEQDAGDTEEYIVERKRTPFRRPRLPDTEG